jgi:hypothetical protein
LPKAKPNPDRITPSPNGAPFLLAGFDPRQIRPRLPARGRRVTAPAQAGAAGLLPSCLGRAPCLRACALRQPDRENAPPERFQAVLWGRQARSAPAQAGAAGLSASCLGRAPCLRACALRQSDRENAPPERFQAVLWGRQARSASAQAGAAKLLASGLGRTPCLRACALRQPDRENASPERFPAVLRGRFSAGCRGVFAGDRSSGTSCGLANRRTPAGPVA